MEMKMNFKTMMMAVCCLGATMFASCDKDDNKDSHLKFSAAKVELAPGATTNVTIGNGAQPFTAKSTDDKTATVKINKNIMTITGVKEGKASIIVTDKNKMTGTVAVNVVKPLSFDKPQVTISAGKEEVVNIKSGKAPYTVQVKDTKIATATVKDAKITIKGVKAGTTTISIVDKDKQAGMITVTVR